MNRGPAAVLLSFGSQTEEKERERLNISRSITASLSFFHFHFHFHFLAVLLSGVHFRGSSVFRRLSIGESNQTIDRNSSCKKKVESRERLQQVK